MNAEHELEASGGNQAEPTSAGAGPEPLPAGLRQDWPVAWQPVWGKRVGLTAELEVASVRAMRAALARAPRVLTSALVEVLARAGRSFDRRHSAAARAFLEQVFPNDSVEQQQTRVLQAWRHFLMQMADGARLERLLPPEQLGAHARVELAPAVAQLLRDRRGCLLITAHVGAFETGACLAPWLGFDPLYVVSRPPKNRALSKLAQRLRERRGVRLLPRRGGIGDIERVLAAGGTVVLMLDQRARKRTVLAPFFGRLAHCERSPAVLARRLGVPLVFGACYLDGAWDRFRFWAPTLIEPSEWAGQAPEAVAARINQELERLILAAPEQHFWLHDRYKRAPPPVSSRS